MMKNSKYFLLAALGLLAAPALAQETYQDTKFAGATAVYNFSVAGDEDHLQVKRNKWRVRMFFGFRF